MTVGETAAGWWGDVPVGVGEGLTLHLGALELSATREPDGWLLAHRYDPAADRAAAVAVTPAPAGPLEGADPERFVAPHQDGLLRLTPRLPDRALVSRPEYPFHVAGGEEVRVFVSCPLWVAVGAGRKARLLRELPSRRLSDTWFGPDTRVGELAYASRTRCRTLLADLPRRPQRAVVPVVVRNRADETLVIERLSLPVPHLPLYADAAGGLWTPQVQITVREPKGEADVEIGRKPPEAGKGPQVAEPRDPAGRSLFTRALGAMIG